MNETGESIVGRWVILVGLAILVGMTGLLWSSLRSPAAVSADGTRSNFECPYTASEECEGVAIAVRPIVQPTAEKALSYQWCVPLNLCFGTSGISFFSEGAAEGAFQGIPNLENGGAGSWQETVENRCFLGVPCWLNDGGVIGEQATEGRGSYGIPSLENAGYQTIQECFPAIPCREGEGGVIGERVGAGPGLYSIPTY